MTAASMPLQAPLDSVVRTEELRRRVPRARDYRAQSEALENLAKALAESPRTILETLCKVSQKVCDAGSAGVSLLSRHDTGASFFWPAITGHWREHVGGGTPRDFGPCGIVLDRDCTQLFVHPERYYPYIQGVMPPVIEALLAPFYVGGKAVGTVWVLTHDPERRFDSEDQRQLESVANFASAAYQVLESLDALEEQGKELQQAQGDLRRELDTMQGLHALVTRLNATADLEAALIEVLKTSVEVGGASRGNVQLFGAEGQAQLIALHRGDAATILKGVGFVDPAGRSAAEQALRSGKRIVVQDMTAEPKSLYLSIATDAGDQAFQSTPLIGAKGEWLGVLSTAFAEPHRFTDRELHILDLYASEAVRHIERTRQQSAIQQAMERIQATLSASEIATWVWDSSTDRVFGDANLRQMFGVAHEHVQGGSLSEYIKAIHPDDRARIERAIFSVVTGATDEYEAEYRVTGADGRMRWVVARGKLQRSPGGKPLRFPGVVIDITARKLAEQALLDADRRKDEFLAMLAHELRNPLAPIRNGVSILEQSVGADQIRPVVSMMQRQLEHMVRLVDDLLDVSRVSRGKIELHRERIELGDVLRQAVEISRPLCERLDHELTLRICERPVFLDADFTRLVQVFGNLLNNASKFTNRGGRIRIVVLEPKDGSVIVRVRDSGIGISAQQLPHIFDLFAQADTSLGRTEGGLGIGLTLVKRIVELHQGTVSASSAGLGHGTEIAIRLPILTQIGPQGSEPALPVVKTLPARRILIVDDNCDAAESLAMLLQLEGHATQVAYDGPTALKIMGDFGPDFVLLDVGLPGMNGHDVARRICEGGDRNRPALIALTGRGQDEDRRLTQESGFDAHLVKPVEFETLRQLLARVPKKHPIAPCNELHDGP